MSGCEEPPAQRLLGNGRGVRVTEMTGPGSLNRAPARHDNPRVEVPLSPAMLRTVCGTEDLSQISCLEICVDTRENTLGNIGACLPGLVELRLNNSAMASVRDLGSTLAHLQVLRLSRCCLQDLDGIIPFTHLKELYLAYNSVSDLSQLSMLDQLQVLDVEGNDVDDLVQVQNLAFCGQLHTLSLQGNPVCVRPHPGASQGSEYSYRVAVRELVPQLRYLDDVRVEEEGPGSISSTMGEEWAVTHDISQLQDDDITQLQDDDVTQLQDVDITQPRYYDITAPFTHDFTQLQNDDITHLQTDDITHLQTDDITAPFTHDFTQLQNDDFTQLQNDDITHLQTDDITAPFTHDFTQLQNDDITHLQTDDITAPFTHDFTQLQNDDITHLQTDDITAP
ncbi:unnamed protein product [Boreogadus saida]